MKFIRLDISDAYGNNTFTVREHDIVSLSTHRQLFDGLPSVGNCFVGELNCVLAIPWMVIPWNGKFVPYVSDDQEHWIQKSEFYVYSREYNEYDGTTSFVCYDPLYYGEESFCLPGNQGTWPRADRDVVLEIATRIKCISPYFGIKVRPESLNYMMVEAAKSQGTSQYWDFNVGYPVPYPGITLVQPSEQYAGDPAYDTTTLTPDTTDGALTMRDVLCNIAACYAGNWIIDNEGWLRLVVLGDIQPETSYLVTEDGDPIVIGGTRIHV